MKIYETKKREERDDNDERPTPEFREASGTLKSPHNALKIFKYCDILITVVRCFFSVTE